MTTLLERLRLDRGLTQFEVERATGVNHKTLVKYERALSDRVLFSTVSRLANFYRVPAVDVLEDIRRSYRSHGEQRDAA